jgi:hypothetical protein
MSNGIAILPGSSSIPNSELFISWTFLFFGVTVISVSFAADFGLSEWRSSVDNYRNFPKSIVSKN